MNKIGLLSGLSFLSGKIYYDKISSILSNGTNDFNPTKIITCEPNNQELIYLFQNKQFQHIESKLLEQVKTLEIAGATCIGLTCDTLHYFLDKIAHHINIPIVHILKIINQQLSNTDIKKVGVVATKHSIKLELHKNYLKQIGICTIYPSNHEASYINTAIFEFYKNLNIKDIQANIINIIDNLIVNGAELIILGSAELGLLVNQSYFDIPVIDSALLHAISLSEYSLETVTE